MTELPHRVLQIHTRYRRRGGEDVVVEAERALLEGAGVEVKQVLFDNNDLDDRDFLSRLRAATSAVWSRSSAERVRRAVERHRPDVVHVHNTFLAASPSIYGASSEAGAAVVQTLHNYRFACPAGTAFRDGVPCTECVGRFVPWPAVMHGSYRGSRRQSAVAALSVVVPKAFGIVPRGIDAYIALTGFQRDLLVRGGLPPDRVRVVPNFLEPDPGIGGDRRNGVLFVGRLDIEKGIETLLVAAARVPGVVRVVGDGPLRSWVEAAAAAGVIEFLGPQPHERVIDEIGRSIAVVIPSIWYEGMPMTLVEAFATGTPVIVSRIGGLAELVSDGVTGLHCAPGDADQLAASIGIAISDPDRLQRAGAAARDQYLRHWCGETHLTALLDVYQMAMFRNRTRLRRARTRGAM